jgi:Pvc16 N-terminal domain
MIGDVLSLLRDQLDAFLRAAAPALDENPADARVQLPDGAKADPIEFRLNAITLLLVNIEQETGLRSADPYLRTAGEGGLRKLQPEIQINLRVLAVARFKVYEQGLNQLGQVIRFLQQHRALEPANTSGWPAHLDRLVLELVTLPQGEQNEIWSALRVSYQPSALFRVRMVVFRDADGAAVPQIVHTRVQVVQQT